MGELAEEGAAPYVTANALEGLGPGTPTPALPQHREE